MVKLWQIVFTVLTEDGTSQVVNIMINGSSDTPVAIDDQVATTVENTVLTVTPSASDSDSDTLTITVDSVTEGRYNSKRTHNSE